MLSSSDENTSVSQKDHPKNCGKIIIMKIQDHLLVLTLIWIRKMIKYKGTSAGWWHWDWYSIGYCHKKAQLYPSRT